MTKVWVVQRSDQWGKTQHTVGVYQSKKLARLAVEHALLDGHPKHERIEWSENRATAMEQRRGRLAPTKMHATIRHFEVNAIFGSKLWQHYTRA